MKLGMVTKIAAAVALVSSSLALAEVDSVEIIDLFEQERIEIQNAVKVFYPSKALADKASITFHSGLLEANKEQGYLIMQLSPQDKVKLKSFGFTFAPATQWIDKRQQKITALQQAAKKRSSAKSNNKAGNKSSAITETIPDFPCYSTVEGTYARAAGLAATYSNLAQWEDIGNSWVRNNSSPSKTAPKGTEDKKGAEGGYDINVLKMTNSATAGDKPILFIHSAMHAREYATAELTIRFAEYLLNNYGTNADTTWILDNHQVHIVFHMNPDGRKRAEAGLSWRKNYNSDHCGNSNSRGVDLNRNFTHFWNATDLGSSGNECAETYRGPTPGSESETQAIEDYIRSIFADRRGPEHTDAAPMDTTGMHLDIHSFSELMLWPWGHTSDLAPNAAELTTLGRKLAFFNGYTPQQSIGLYATDGTSDDVSYGELGLPAYTFELGTSFFQSCSGFTNTVLPDNLQSLLYAAKVVRAPYIIPAGPDAADLTLNGLSTASVDAGDVVTIKATINDARYENSNGVEPSQLISGAEYYIDQAPWDNGAQAFSLQTSDGTLDTATEDMQAQIDTTGLSNGKHMIYVRGKDADDNWGAVSAAYLLIGQVNTSPQASFENSCQGLRCTLDASASADDDGEITHYRWDLGDGTIVEGGSEVVTIEHLYSASGDMTASLTVTDDKGATTTAVSIINVENLPPVAQFSVNCTNNECQFDASGSGDLDGVITSYEWTLEGSVTTDGLSANHTFALAGTFDVTLTVTDNLGLTHSHTTSVTVTLPVVDIIIDQVNNSSSGGGSLGFGGLLLLGGGLFRRFGFVRRVNSMRE